MCGGSGGLSVSGIVSPPAIRVVLRFGERQWRLGIRGDESEQEEGNEQEEKQARHCDALAVLWNPAVQDLHRKIESTFGVRKLRATLCGRGGQSMCQVPQDVVASKRHGTATGDEKRDFARFQNLIERISAVPFLPSTHSFNPVPSRVV